MAGKPLNSAPVNSALTALVLGAVALLAAAPASAAGPPVSHPRVLVHYDLAAGEQPENVLVRPDGELVVALSAAREVATVDRQGRTRVIATLPRPADGGGDAPVLGFPLVGGLVRTPDGTVYVNYTAGDGKLTGIWRIRAGSQPERIVALPAGSFLNGLDLDARTGLLYCADSALGVVWRAPLGGGTATRWAEGAALEPGALLGANGLKVHNGAVWTSDSDQGTLLRIPIGRDGRALAPQTRATGQGFIDDFVFPGRGDTVLAAVDVQNQVVLIEPDGRSTAVLTAADGLQGPTSVALDHGRIYVLSAAFVTAEDPNIVVARIDGRFPGRR